MTKTDIQNREDIDYLIKTFYEKAMKDDLIGHFFTKIVQLDLSEHLPKIVDFWESILFQNAKYKGNPMVKHIQLNRMSAIEDTHFRRWLELWCETIDEYYEGDFAEKGKTKAKSISLLMQYKIRMDEF